MLEWVPWILLAIVVFFWFGGQRTSQTKRLALESFVIYLLLDDHIRENSTQKFVAWVAETPAKDAMDLGMRGHRAVSRFADDLHNAPEMSSLLGANAVLWNFKKDMTGADIGATES